MFALLETYGLRDSPSVLCFSSGDDLMVEAGENQLG